MNMDEFEEYIRATEPDKKQRAENWRTAIGLQDVDGLKTSDYLRQTAQRNIEGEITIDEARRLVHTYYETKSIREADDDNKNEADKMKATLGELKAKNSATSTEQAPNKYRTSTEQVSRTSK